MGKPLTSGEVTPHHSPARVLEPPPPPSPSRGHARRTAPPKIYVAPRQGKGHAAPTAARHHRYRPVGVGGGLRRLEIGLEMGSQARLWSGLFRRLSIEERWISKPGFGRWSCGARHGVGKPLSAVLGLLRGQRARGARVMVGLGSVCCRLKISLPFWCRRGAVFTCSWRAWPSTLDYRTRIWIGSFARWRAWLVRKNDFRKLRLRGDHQLLHYRRAAGRRGYKMNGRFQRSPMFC
jgi:hypothetical protein